MTVSRGIDAGGGPGRRDGRTPGFQVTEHARARCRERGIAVETLEREVEEAERAGRRTKRKPRWAWPGEHDRSLGGKAQPGTWRYFFDGGERRAYLCRRTPAGWRVVTVNRPPR